MSVPTPEPSPELHDNGVVESEPPQPRRRGPWIALAGALVAIVAVAIALSVEAETEDGDPIEPADARTILEEAAEVAGVGDVGDDGNSLFLDGEGEETGSGTVTVDDAVAVLVWTEVPDHVVTVMSQTRALDGMQSAEWDTESHGPVSAQWTYHPDNGLDIVLTVMP